MVDPITYIALMLQIDPAVAAAWVPLLILTCNFIARKIPDNAGGLLGIVRKICKVVGLHASSTITKGVTIEDIVRAQSIGLPVTTQRSGLFNTRKDGRVGINEGGFVDLRLLGLVAVSLGFVALLGGCATTKVAAEYLCKNREAVIAAAQQYCGINWDRPTN